MTHAIREILTASAPLLFATLGALVSEYAGVLAVFMDGAITLSGFICVACAIATGSPVAGYLAATVATVALLFAVARFTERTGANPFITGLAVNLLATGLTSWLSVALFDTRGVIPLGLPARFPREAASAVAFSLAVVLALALRHTRVGLVLRVSGSSPEALRSRGLSPSRYRTASWCVAAFFAAAAGSALALGLGAWVPNLSAGRGWTALAAVYLGYKRPIPCVAAVILFSVAEYGANAIQGLSLVPATVVLGLPYLLALLAFVVIPRKKD